MTIHIERAYSGRHGTGGARYLVDLLWPRGVTKGDLHLDGWLRELAPSAALRQWFGHDPERWAEFEARYWKELDAKPDALEPLVAAARAGDLTLVFGAKDEEHNNAVALRDYLTQRRRMRKARPARR
jgi:uncharacterized protein YeaO (DUF488 family)